jgi:Gpi18-like mannosyltransferase
VKSPAGLGLLVVAIVATLTVGHVLRDTPGYMVRNPDGSLSGDLTHYVYWTRLITLGGIQTAYSGTWPETYAVYPPVTLLPLELVGTLYQHTQDPSFDADHAQGSLWLREGIKFAALIWHILTGVAIYGLVRGNIGAVAASVYLLNPAALYDVAHWAQPDGAHALFSVLAVGFFGLEQVVPAWGSMAAAAMAKPQAWFVVPLLVIATFRRWGMRGLALAAAAGGVVTLLISAPFIVTGHARELLSLPLATSTVMPVVSADAHNVWWLLLQLRGQDPLLLQDSVRAIGPLTYRVLAACLVGASVLLTWWLYWTSRASLAETAALGVLGWFTFTTQAHENHLFFALPLLALAWPHRRSLLVPLAVLSVTLLMNMLLHDQLVLESLRHALNGDPVVERLRLLNALTNVTCFVAWSAWATLRSTTRPQAVHAVRRLGYSDHVAVGLEASSD